MDTTRFDSTQSKERVAAITELLAGPTPEATLAFMKLWQSGTRGCDDLKPPPGATPEQTSAAQRAHGALEGAINRAHMQLREGEAGVAVCVTALGTKDPGGAERGLGVALKYAPQAMLVAAMTQLVEADAAAGARAIERLLPVVEADEPRHGALAALAPKKKAKKKKAGAPKKAKVKKPKDSARAKEILSTTNGGSDIRDEVEQLANEPSVKGLDRAKLFARLARWSLDPDERLAYYEQGWEQLPNKKKGDPGWPIVRQSLDLAMAKDDEALVLRWFLRLKEHETPSGFKSQVGKGYLAPWLARPGFREHVLPKYAKSMAAVTDQLNAGLVATCALWTGYGSQPYASRVGGKPYLPGGNEWPADKKGVPMHFLCQLNFEDLPSPAGFPRSGLLLLFVPNDSMLGMSFHGRSEYGAVWVESTTGGRSPIDPGPHEKRSFAEGFRNRPLVTKPSPMGVKLQFQPPIPFNARFEALVPGAAALTKSALKSHHKKFANPSSGYSRWHRLGGYAAFIQEDPRKGDTAEYIQLLQLDSYDPWGIQFGDGGLAHFFIHPDDLAARRFDNMLYYWDCA